MDISIIISTRNRANRLEPFLLALEKIEYSGSWEAIIVDNASTDSTFDVLDVFSRESSCPVKVLKEARGGKTFALNTGIRHASGDILSFTDDDCYVNANFLEQTVAAFSDEEVGFITGRILLFDPADAPVTIEESTDPKTFPAKTFIDSRGGYIHGANMAIRRSAVEAVGGFDPLFGPGAKFSAAEDVDIVARVNLLGWAGRYDPTVVVAHHHGRREKDLPALFRAYSRGRGAYHMKLLLKFGKLHWFLSAATLRFAQISRHPKAVLREMAASIEYLFQSAILRLPRRD